MKIFFRIVLGFLALLFLLLAHIGAVYMFPYPLNTINIVFGMLIVFLVLFESGSVVWLSFIIHFFIELYTVAPFGILLFTGGISVLFVYWFFKAIFTNRSWYTAATLCLIGLCIYRSMYMLFLIVTGLVRNERIPPVQSFGVLFLWEALFTTVFVTGVYLLIRYYRQQT